MINIKLKFKKVLTYLLHESNCMFGKYYPARTL